MKEIFIWTGALLVTILLLGLAWKRPNRQRLWLRLLATAGAILSITLLAIPPHRTVKIPTTEALLLTPGYSLDSLQSLQKQLPAGTQLFRYTGEAAGYPALSSLTELRQKYPRVKRLHVLGYGLEEPELKQLDAVRIVPHLNNLPPGVIHLDWPRLLTAGEKVRITGRYYLTTQKPTWLYLKVAGKAQDSTRINTTGLTRFTLTYLPKQPGLYVYALNSQSSGKSSFTGEIPVQVKPKPKLRILLLPSSPAFEVKFLKNYLASELHEVIVRLPISKNIYQTEWLNLPQTPIKQMDARFWQQFDVLITDPGILQELNSREQQALTQAVQNTGLGLLVIPAQLPLNSSSHLLKSFQFVRNPLLKIGAEATPVSWLDYPTAVKSIALPYNITLTSSLKKLAWDKDGACLAATQRRGWGKITVSLLPQTFTWLLAGDKAAFAAYWTLLLSQTGKPSFSDHSWHVVAPSLPLADKPLTLQLADYTNPSATSGPRGVVQAADQQPDTVYLAQQVLLPHRFTGSFWPRQPGWHQIKKPAGAAHSFYVFADSSFTSWQQANRLRTTRHYVQTTAKNSLPAGLITQKQPLPAIYFFLAFLICAGFLWLEEKW